MQTDEINVFIDEPKDTEQIFEILTIDPVVGQVENQYDVEVSTSPIKLNDSITIRCSALEQYLNAEELKQVVSKKYEQRLRMISDMALNGIAKIKYEQNKVRQMIWDSVVRQYEQRIKQEFMQIKIQQQIKRYEKRQQQLKNIKQIQQQKCQQVQIQEQINQKLVIQIQNNILRMFKKLGIKQQENMSKQLKNKIVCMIVAFQKKQQLLGNIKGLQYICYAICMTSPHKQFHKNLTQFLYIMQILNIKMIFYPGSPLFYSQLTILCKQLQKNVQKLYKYLQKLNVDWSKIFVAYYKSLLLNKIQNIYVINKIIDLIMIYGINVIKIILVKIIKAKQNQFDFHQEPQKLMQILGTQLVYMWFGKHEMTEKHCQNNGEKLKRDPSEDICHLVKSLEMDQKEQKNGQKEQKQDVKKIEQKITNQQKSINNNKNNKQNVLLNEDQVIEKFKKLFIGI